MSFNPDSAVVSIAFLKFDICLLQSGNINSSQIQRKDLRHLEECPIGRGNRKRWNSERIGAGSVGLYPAILIRIYFWFCAQGSLLVGLGYHIQYSGLNLYGHCKTNVFSIVL